MQVGYLALENWLDVANLILANLRKTVENKNKNQKRKKNCETEFQSNY